MSAPTAEDAAARRMVRIDDGRRAVLIYVPIREVRHRGRSGGSKAKVRLSSGKVISVAPEYLTVVDE